MASAARIQKASAALARVAPDLMPAQHLLILAHALAESQFGDAFATPDGSSSFNWGAIYAKGDRGTLPRGDYDPAGRAIRVGAAWNSSDDVGAMQLVQLLRNAYPEAFAAAGKASPFEYSVGLWRDGVNYPGHSVKRPAYYVGFPPGHKWSLAPAGTRLYSPADFHWRKVAYGRFVRSYVPAVKAAIASPVEVDKSEPPPPPEPPAARTVTSAGGSAAPLIALALLAFWRFKR